MSTFPSKSVRPMEFPSTRDDTNIASLILFTTAGTDKEYRKTADLVSDIKYVSVFNGPGISATSQPMVEALKQKMSKGSIATVSLDGVNPYFGIFNNFILTRMDESKSEISKLHLNFSENWNVFMFGSNPTVMSCTGNFIDTQGAPHYQEFMVAYEKFLKGSKSVENKMNVVMTVDGRVISGIILNVSTVSDANSENLKSFNFQILIKKQAWNRYNLVEGSDPEFNRMSNRDRVRNHYGITFAQDLTLAQILSEGADI